MAIRLSDSQPVSPIRGALRSGRYDSYRMQGHRHVGTAHETLASQRDHPCDAASEADLRDNAVDYVDLFPIRMPISFSIHFSRCLKIQNPALHLFRVTGFSGDLCFSQSPQPLARR